MMKPYSTGQIRWQPRRTFAGTLSAFLLSALMMTVPSPAAGDPLTPLPAASLLARFQLGLSETEPDGEKTTSSKETKKSAPARKKKKKKNPKVAYSGKFSLRLVYDDNIIHYSDDDLDEFVSVINEGRFSITQAGDWIIRPRLMLKAKSKALTGKTLEARLTMSGWRYFENDVKNNESYSLLLKHPGWGRDNFQLTLYKAPFAYLRNYKDRPPFTPGSTPSEFSEFSYTSNSATLKYWRRYSKKLDGTLRAGRSIRFYNRPFMENDVWEWNFGGTASYRFAKPVKVSFEYLYSDAEARGADEVDETLENSDDGDATYERDSYRLSIYVYPRYFSRWKISKLSTVSLKWQYQAYYYTSKNNPHDDSYHVGRLDEVSRLETTWSTGKIYGPVSLEGGYRFTERASSAPGGGDDAAIGEVKDYTDNRFWMGAEYPF